jgi:hypothetical protein
MLPLLAPATREPRPVERSVAWRPGIVFAIFDTPPESGGGFPRCWNSSPPPSSAARSAIKSVENRYFVAEKLLKLFALPSPATPSRHASAASACGTSRRMVRARTRCSAQTLLIFERVSDSKLRERVKQNKDHAE